MLTPTPSGCEQQAARTLGFTQASWDDESGKELLPWSFAKYWDQLTPDERKAAKTLGWNEINWDNYDWDHSKFWDELRSCANGKNLHPWPSAVSSCFSVSVP